MAVGPGQTAAAATKEEAVLEAAPVARGSREAEDVEEALVDFPG